MNKRGLFSDSVDHLLLIYVIITSVLGIVAVNSAAASAFSVTMASLWPVEWAAMWAMAASTLGTTATARI